MAEAKNSLRERRLRYGGYPILDSYMMGEEGIILQGKDLDPEEGYKGPPDEFITGKLSINSDGRYIFYFHGRDDRAWKIREESLDTEEKRKKLKNFSPERIHGSSFTVLVKILDDYVANKVPITLKVKDLMSSRSTGDKRNPNEYITGRLAKKNFENNYYFVYDGQDDNNTFEAITNLYGITKAKVKGETPQPLLTDEQYLNYTKYLEEEKALDDALKEGIIKIIRGGREQYDSVIEHRISLDMFIPAENKKEFRKLEDDYQDKIEVLEAKYQLDITKIVKGKKITELLNKPKLLLNEFNMRILNIWKVLQTCMGTRVLEKLMNIEKKQEVVSAKRVANVKNPAANPVANPVANPALLSQGDPL